MRVCVSFRRPSSVGFPSATAERYPSAVHRFHSVEKPGDGRVQDCRSTRSRQTVGHTEKSFVDELRQDVPGIALLLPSQHSQEGAGRETLLPVSNNNDN